MSNAPKAKITEENLEESRRLKNIWTNTGHGGLTQDAFGEKYGIGSQSAVGFFLNGKSAISMKAAIGFAKGLGCQISDFSARLAAVAQDASTVNQIHSNLVDASLSSFHQKTVSQPSKIDPLAKSLADKVEELGEMLAVFASEEVLNMAFLKCQLVIEEFKMELSRQEKKFNSDNVLRDVKPAAAPKKRLDKHR